QAGAIVARNFTEFQDLFLLAETLHGKIIGGNRLAAVSGAGFEAVGMADSIQCDDFSLELAEPTPETWEKVGAVLREKHLDALVTPANPLDINPGADDDAHARVTEILARDPGVDALVVSLDPLSPAVGSLDGSDVAAFDMNRPGSIKELMVGLCERIPTPVLAVVDGGRLYDPLRDALMGANIPVFPVCDRAVVALGLYVQGRLRARDLRDKNNEH
ncbi:MAG: CoA-binding protein, partial [Desulfovibrionales bacterium]|nr:CoA-binding protein [Desulfovibrionales bacterium]